MFEDTSLSEDNHRALHALGLFVTAWSVLEASLEVAISQQLGLCALDSSHITAGMQFKPKAVMLRSLLGRDKDKNAKAIALVNQMMNRGERNDLLHSIMGFNREGLIFIRRRNDRGRFTSEEKPYTQGDLVKLATDITDLSAALKVQLHITDADYDNWIHEAHRDANKAG